MSAPRRHLMVPGQPPRAAADRMSLTSVQRWIMSTLAVTTILHLSGGVVLAAAAVDKHTSRIGLLVIAAAFGVIAIATGLLIHRRTPLHPVLLVGLLPALAGAVWLL